MTKTGTGLTAPLAHPRPVRTKCLSSCIGRNDHTHLSLARLLGDYRPVILAVPLRMKGFVVVIEAEVTMRKIKDRWK